VEKIIFCAIFIIVVIFVLQKHMLSINIGYLYSRKTSI